MSVDFESPKLERAYGDRSVDEDWRSWCTEHLDPIAKDIVDLGCGGGIYTRGFAELGARSVIGIDASAQYVHEAAHASAAQPQTRFTIGTVAATGLDDESSDIVFHRAVIHHLDEAEQAQGAAEMFRILRSNGVCVVQDRTIEDVESTDPRHWIRATLFETFPRLLSFENARRPSTARYAGILEHAGFAVPRVLIYPEVRKVYSSFAELETEVMARKGKSILHELSDPELRTYCQNLSRRAPASAIVETDAWTVWIARKPERAVRIKSGCARPPQDP